MADPTDYSALGFRCGLEIHQQLEGKKLFCSCPTLNSDKNPNLTFERRLRAVAGETGNVDIAAKHEMEKGKNVLYLANTEDVCLVEMDEDPPHEMNKDALYTAIQVSLLLHCRVVDGIQVMRKTVVDGSNVSGFQRTALVGMDGYLESSQGKVAIPTICLEEEAAQKVQETNSSVTYRLDRLGIPLIEIATGSALKNPEHVKEVAGAIGMVLRSVQGIKRGIGTIRQDVNVSIKGGTRTEVKGFQDLRSITKVIDFEVQRQLELIGSGKKPVEEVRKAEPDFTTSFLRPMPGSARMYPETDVAPIKIAQSWLKTIQLPVLMSERLGSYEKQYGVNKEKLNALMKPMDDGNSAFSVFESAVKECKNLKPAYISETLLAFPTELLEKFPDADPSKVVEKHWIRLFKAIDDGLIAKESLVDALGDIAFGKEFSLDKFRLEEVDLEKEARSLIKEKPGLSFGAYMGMLMGKFKGKVDGKKVSGVLKMLVP